MSSITYTNRQAQRRAGVNGGARKTSHLPGPRPLNDDRPDTDSSETLADRLNRSATVDTQLRLRESLNHNPRVVAQRRLARRLSGQPGLPQPRTRIPVSSASVIQRVKINKGEIAGLPADFDSDQLQPSIQTIDALVDAGHKTALMLLRGVLFGKKGVNDTALVARIDSKLKSGPEVPDREAMRYFEKRGIGKTLDTQPPVREDVRTGLNMWVVGDPKRGINWEMVGKHLRGRLTDEDYRLIGTLESLRVKKDFDRPTLIAMGKQQLDAVHADIGGALDKLPDFVGRSYRLAGVKSTDVFGSKIGIGDLIKDTTFWSTAAVRGAGAAAASWGKPGTAAKPMAYFIIDGATGKYIGKYSKIEGEREVLFKDHVVFLVKRIVNLGTTFYVYIQELSHVPLGASIKNPFTGDPYGVDDDDFDDDEFVPAARVGKHTTTLALGTGGATGGLHLRVTSEINDAIGDITHDAGLKSEPLVSAVQLAFKAGLPYASRQQLLATLERPFPENKKRVAAEIAEYIVENFGA